MKTKLFFTLLLALALVATLGWNVSAALAVASCDSAYVTQSGNVITVKPTGVDDTANIQCAFDASGAGNEVHLSAGTFHTAQIVVNDFHGRFTGAGMNKTAVVNLPNLYVAPVDVVFNPPSAANPWPNLFSFIDGDFAISDLAINIVGDDLTTGWTIYGIDPPIEELANAIMISGTHANARVERIVLQGEKLVGSFSGYTLINGIYYEGNIGEIPSPMTGSYSLTNSALRSIAFATPVYNLSNAFVVISGNSYQDTFTAADATELQNTSYEFSHNKIVGTALGLDFWTSFGYYEGSTIFVRNNVINGAIGIAFEMTFGDGNQCLIAGNNVANATDLGIFLGTGTTGCTVVGGNTKANVLDLGTDNVLVGVNNMGTGVGPDIQNIKKMFR